MSSFLPDWRVDIRLRPSRLFQCLSAGLHLAAVLALLLSALPLALKVVLIPLLLLLLLLAWRHERAHEGIAVSEQEEGWWVEAGARQGMAVLERAQVWRYLVVMDFRAAGPGRRWRRRVAVLPDALGEDDFRRLRVRLRHGRRQPGPASAN